MLAMSYMDSMVVSPVYQQYQVDVAAGQGANWNLIPQKFVLKDGLGGKGGDVTLPASYSLVDAGYGTTIKNQGADGDCWAFATTTAIESNLKKTKGLAAEVSPKQLDYLLASNGSTVGSGSSYYDHLAGLGLSRNLGEGGNFFMASFPLGGQYAPTTEASFFAKMQANDSELAGYSSWRQFQDNNTLKMQLGADISAYAVAMPQASLLEKSDFVVTDYRLIFGDQDNIGAIKEAVYNYGAAYVGTIAPEVDTCWDAATKTIVDRGVICGNENGHAMTIVGWDDSHIYTDPSDGSTKTGAFLLQNSWGDSSIFSDYGLDADRIMNMLDATDKSEEEIAALRTQVEDFLANYSADEYVWLGYDFEDSSVMGTIDFASIQVAEENNYANVYDSVGTIGLGGTYSGVEYSFSAARPEYIGKFAFATHGIAYNAAVEYVISVDSGDGYAEAGRVVMPAEETGQISVAPSRDIMVDGAFKVKIEGYVGGEKVEFPDSDDQNYWTVSVYTTDEALVVPETGSVDSVAMTTAPNTGMFTRGGFAEIAGVLVTVAGLVAAAIGIYGYKNRKHLFRKVDFNKK